MNYLDPRLNKAIWIEKVDKPSTKNVTPVPRNSFKVSHELC